MNNFWEQIALAFGGLVFHTLKQVYENVKRNEQFNMKLFYLSAAMNVLAIFILIYIGKQLPPELIVMSPLTCVIMGFFGSSILASFIDTKKPSGAVDNSSDLTKKP